MRVYVCMYMTVCMYVHVCMYVRMHVCICIGLCMYCIPNSIHVCVGWMDGRIDGRMDGSTDRRTDLHMLIIYIYIYIYIYIHASYKYARFQRPRVWLNDVWKCYNFLLLLLNSLPCVWVSCRLSRFYFSLINRHYENIVYELDGVFNIFSASVHINRCISCKSDALFSDHVYVWMLLNACVWMLLNACCHAVRLLAPAGFMFMHCDINRPYLLNMLISSVIILTALTTQPQL